MKKRFIFDENYIKKYAKKDKLRWLIIGGIALVIVLIIIIVLLSKNNKSNPNKPTEKIEENYKLKEELVLETGSTVPDVADYFQELENIDIKNIEVIYPEEYEISYDTTNCSDEDIAKINNATEEEIKDFACVVPVFNNPQVYGVTVKVKEEEYTVIVKVVDTKAPSIIVKNLEIYKGEEYSAKDFVNSCIDQSGECILSYYDKDIAEDGHKIDYSSFKDAGEYTIKIVAEDLYGNTTEPVEAKLIIKETEAKVYTVSFNSDGGTQVDSIKVEENATIKEPNAPTKNGYKFLGWYLGNDKFNFNDQITKDLTLVAKWEVINNQPSGGGTTNPINPPTVSSISLDYRTIYLTIGEAKTVKASVYPANAVNKDVTWSSSNNAIATVNGGIITGVAAGTTTINATSNGKTASVTVIVRNNASSACPYGDANYNNNYILSVNLTNNGCAVNPNGSYNETVSSTDYQKLFRDLTNMGFDLNSNNFTQKYVYTKVMNNTGTGLIGYTITCYVTVIDGYYRMPAEYVIRPNGTRQFNRNSIIKNGVKLQ